MYKPILYVIVAVLFFSCKKDGNYTETIISGGKWGIQINSTPAEAYAQVQALKKKYTIYDIALQRPPITNLADVKEILPLYNSIKIVNKADNDTINVAIKEEKVFATYSKKQSTITKWPQAAPDAAAVLRDDAVTALYGKLVEVFKLPGYQNCQVLLNYKPVNKTFDPSMANLNTWNFSFLSENGKKYGAVANVTLIFEAGKLMMIENSRKEFRTDVYN